VIFDADPALASTPLAKINNVTLERFVQRRRAAGANDNTINRALALVSSVLNQAATKWTPRLLQSAERIELLPIEVRVVRRPITWDEQRALVAALRHTSRTWRPSRCTRAFGMVRSAGCAGSESTTTPASACRS